MIKEAIGEALTVEQARDNALILLHAPENADVKFDTVSLPQKKLLGLFGGSKAKVRAYYEDGKAEPKPAVVAEKPQPKKAEPAKTSEAPKKPEKKPEKKAEKLPASQKPIQPERNERTQEILPAAQVEEMAKEAKAYLEALIAGLNVPDATVSTTQGENSILLEISCEDYGIIVGRRGETLDSIQYLVSLVANKNCNSYVRITVNVGNYREKREATLRGVARKNALYVARTGRRVVLEPMNPYERRIIHTTVQDMENVSSRSVGSNNERKVVIELADGATANPALGGREHNDRGQRKGGYNNRRPRPQSATVSEEPAQKKLDKNDLPKFGKIE